MGRVKRIRKYDSRNRLEQARRNRETILEVARRAFLASGYAATTVASIASAAGVSVETVYKSFGGKPGLVKAIIDRGLAGSGPVPAPERSDTMSSAETNPQAIVRKWGALAAEVSPLVSPLLLLLRSAAATDGELASVLRAVDEQRLTRMRHNVRKLARRGFLRRGLTIEKATDVAWTASSAELYDLLVVRRGWSPAQLGEFVATLLSAALLG